MSEEELEPAETYYAKTRAATCIQSTFRGYLYRYNVSQQDIQDFCAKKIQRAWRRHYISQKLQSCREILARRVIRKAVARYLERKEATGKLNNLKQFEDVLTFFPAKSKPFSGKSTTKSMVGAFNPDGTLKPEKRKKSRRGRDVPDKDPGPTKKQPPKPPRPKTRGAKRRVAGAMVVGATREKKERIKRKVLVKLPPPWHDKDPRRLSNTAQEDLLEQQKSNVAWAKAELIPMLLLDCGKQLDLRDELLIKNDRFMARILQKMFLQPMVRNTKQWKLQGVKDIAFMGATGMYLIATATSVLLMELHAFIDDELVLKAAFKGASPLFDVLIHRSSGFCIGIDNEWVMHLFDQGESVMKVQLPAPNKIPKIRRYLAIDHFGLIWVNLLPQKGPILCFDPLTMHASVQVNYEQLIQHQKMLENVTYLAPLHLKDRPWGFVATCKDDTDVYLFNPEFSRCKRLKHPNMTTFPNIKQVNERLVVWSEDCVIYVYELNTIMEATQCAGSFKVPAKPTDVSAVQEPDLIFVAMSDSTVRVYLGSGSELPSRIPNARLNFSEKSFAERLLGSITYTNSCGAFLEKGCCTLLSVPVKIDAFQMTGKLSCIEIIYANGSCGSCWIMNDSQPVKAIDFEQFQYYEPHQSLSNAVAMFQTELAALQKKRAGHLNLLKHMRSVEEQSSKGQLKNIFMRNQSSFEICSLVENTTLRSLFPYLPIEPDMCLTAYEVFHYILRSGVLPVEVSTFSSFLTRFAPKDTQIAVQAPEAVVNRILPVRTGGLYHGIVDIPFTMDKIREIVAAVDPLTNLSDQLSNFSISRAIETGSEDASTKRKWISRYERRELQKRLMSLTALGDIVKHELMNRIQKDMSDSFHRNLLDKMLPITPFDITQRVTYKNGVILSLYPKPNRNPLLDEKRHNSVYETWSDFTLFGRDRTGTQQLRALHIQNSLFQKPCVASHFDLVRRLSLVCKHVSSQVFSVVECQGDLTQVIITEEKFALPLSHYLTIHSYLGSTRRSLDAARSILGNILTCLYELHKNNIIMRTLCPENVLLNPENHSIKISNMYDVQLRDSVMLPLPEQFANPSNPFLPPEYFHVPPKEYTTAFDIWQFGMLLLYIITGFKPKAYGEELMKYMTELSCGDFHDWNTKRTDPLADPKIYPKYGFFYDWLTGCTIVKAGDSVMGQSGECFIAATNPDVPTSILQLANYNLLPYKNTKLNYDESKIYLEIISSCLQIDPAKRPTVEELLRTYPFNQATQIGDFLSSYMRMPNPNVFASQFFSPVLRNLGEATFPFAMGIITALLFHDEMNDEDVAFSFPLDSRASERVITALFDLKFMDRIVEHVLNEIDSRIQATDVIPVVKFTNPKFDLLVKFFMRFVASVDRGQGTLISHIDEVIMSLLSVYAANMHLKRPSAQLLTNATDVAELIYYDSAPSFAFTYTQLHALVRYSLQWTGYIYNSLKRTTEHDDNYFDQFMSFSDAAYNFATAMCHSVEKQRMCAIKTMESLWSSNTGVSTVRLFLDFRIPQKVVQCFPVHGARMETASFVLQSLSSSKAKTFDPTFSILRMGIKCPGIFGLCATIFRSFQGNDMIKPSCIEIVKSLLFGDYPWEFENLVFADVIWSLGDMARDQQLANLLTEATTKSSPVIMQLIQSSKPLQKILNAGNIPYRFRFDQRTLLDNVNIAEALDVTKKLMGNLIMKQSFADTDMVPLDKATDYFKKVISMVVHEADSVAKFFDTQLMRVTRFEIKESSFMQTKTKEKEIVVAGSHAIISEICRVFVQLFKVLCFYWQSGIYGSYRKDLVQMILELVVAPIPSCRSMVHPVTILHWSLQEMIFYAISHLPRASQARQDVEAKFTKVCIAILTRDIAYTVHCAEKEQIDNQLITRYPVDRRTRFRLLKVFVSHPELDINPFLEFVVGKMLHNTAIIRTKGSFKQACEMQYPLRTEAVEMISFLLESNEKYPKSVRVLVDSLLSQKFLKRERKMTERNDKFLIIESSVRLLRTILRWHMIFSEEFVKRASFQLDTLITRFHREWDDSVLREETATAPPPVPKKLTPLPHSAMKGNKVRPRAKTGLIPKRPGPKIVKNVKVLGTQVLGSSRTPQKPRK